MRRKKGAWIEGGLGQPLGVREREGRGGEGVGGGGELKESGRGERESGIEILYLYALLFASLSAAVLQLSGNPTPQRCTSPRQAAVLLATR